MSGIFVEQQNIEISILFFKGDKFNFKFEI